MRTFLIVLALALCAVPPSAANPFGSDCSYPEAAKAAGPAGNTDLNFIVAPDGSLRDVTVKRPSRNPALDAAAVECVSGWHVPGDPKWQNAVNAHFISIFWDLNVVPPAGRASFGRPHVCMEEYPAISVRLGEQGTTVLAFRITTAGTVKEPRILVSSGSDRLDAAALACVASWRYRPAVQDGKPIEVEWKAEVKWSLREPPSLLERLFN